MKNIINLEARKSKQTKGRNLEGALVMKGEEGTWEMKNSKSPSKHFSRIRK
jgi:hypothetical protein